MTSFVEKSSNPEVKVANPTKLLENTLPLGQKVDSLTGGVLSNQWISWNYCYERHICISGREGSGKSALALNLYNLCIQNGMEAFYFTDDENAPSALTSENLVDYVRNCLVESAQNPQLRFREIFLIIDTRNDKIFSNEHLDIILRYVYKLNFHVVYVQQKTIISEAYSENKYRVPNAVRSFTAEVRMGKGYNNDPIDTKLADVSTSYGYFSSETLQSAAFKAPDVSF